MATTRLSDVIVPEQWTPNFLLESPELVALFNSGIVTPDPVLGQLANGEGHTFHIRHMNDLVNNAENISSDDPAETSTPDKTSGGQQLAVKLARNKSWSSMDLVAAFHTPDPVATIRSRVASYWARRFQAATVSVLNGVMARNIAADSGDMVHAAPTAEISGDAILSAKATMGDAAEALDAIVMHSIKYTALQKANLIQYLRDGDANVQFPTYLGYRVIVDDGVPVDTTGDDPVYTSILFGSGALRIGFGQPKTPVEVERKPDAGNGEGEEVFYSRQHFILHPAGFSYTGSAPNPANAALATAGNWNRVFDRKQVPIAFLQTA